MAEINTLFKDNVLKLANDESLIVEYLPTGILPIDILLQGGLPRGRFVEIYGEYSTLKSFVGLSAIANTQKAGGVCAIIDTEHSFDPSWAAVIVIQPITGELAMDSAEALIRGNCDLIVFDSIAAALPQTERNKRLHDETLQPARLAQLMSLGMRKLTAANSKTAMMWINQTRLNVGITFGNPESIPGGKSMPFYASYRINMKKVGKITRDIQAWEGEKWVASKEQIGQKFKAIVEKSKLSKPFRDIYFTWDFETGGIDEAGFLIAMGLEEGFITQEGKSWIYETTKVVGRENFKKAVQENLELMEELRTKVMELHSLGKPTQDKSKVAKVKRKSLKNSESDSTLTVAQEK